MDIETILAWLRDNLDVALAVGSAFVALVSAAFARNETRKQRLLQREQLRQNIDKASVDWGAEAIDVLSEASVLALSAERMNTLELVPARLQIARRISALVDRGRLFFPNLDPQGKGAEKDGAYRGSRPPVLDALMYAYHEVLSIGTGVPDPADTSSFIMECRRLLVSELQAHLDPRRLDEVVGRYDAQRRADREAALDKAGFLRLVLDARRPGVMDGDSDESWASRIPADQRRHILAEYGVRHADHPHDYSHAPDGPAPDRAEAGK